MENLFNELTHVDDNLKTSNKKLLDVNSLANDWAVDYSRNSTVKQQNSNKLLPDLQWSSDYLTQTESTLYNDT